MMKKWFRSLYQPDPTTRFPIDGSSDNITPASLFVADAVANAGPFGSAVLPSSIGRGQSPATQLISSDHSKPNPALVALTPAIIQSMQTICSLQSKQRGLQRRLKTLSAMNRDDERRLNDFIGVLDTSPTTPAAKHQIEGALLRLERLFARSTELSERLVADMQANKQELALSREGLEDSLRQVLEPWGLFPKLDTEEEDGVLGKDLEEQLETPVSGSVYSESEHAEGHDLYNSGPDAPNALLVPEITAGRPELHLQTMFAAGTPVHKEQFQHPSIEPLMCLVAHSRVEQWRQALRA